MNLIGWLLTIAGGVVFAAATIGVIYTFVRPGDRIISSETSLHDTYYVIAHSKTIIWPLLLCMALSAAITIIGYSRTDHFINRMLRPALERAEKP
jgi:heme/copper-type cytochrome/quinol oxidase subunit 1